MNSPSLRNRWLWKNQSGGESSPERQTVSEGGACARWRAMGQHLARLTALALGAWLLLGASKRHVP